MLVHVFWLADPPPLNEIGLANIIELLSVRSTGFLIVLGEIALAYVTIA